MHVFNHARVGVKVVGNASIFLVLTVVCFFCVFFNLFVQLSPFVALFIMALPEFDVSLLVDFSYNIGNIDSSLLICS